MLAVAFISLNTYIREEKWVRIRDSCLHKGAEKDETSKLKARRKKEVIKVRTETTKQTKQH